MSAISAVGAADPATTDKKAAGGLSAAAMVKRLSSSNAALAKEVAELKAALAAAQAAQAHDRGRAEFPATTAL